MAGPSQFRLRRSLLFALPLILVATIFVGISALPTAHAAGYPGGSGIVCLNDGSAAPTPPSNPCPSTPYKFDGPFPSSPQVQSTEIRVGVYVNGSAPLNGFDVTLIADHTILKPVGYDLTGTVLLGTPSVVGECLSGTLIVGGACLATGADTLQLAATSQLGFGLTIGPTTGLLFTAIYSVVGTTPVGGISVGFQTGCAGTSVTGTVCVTITNGSISPVPETVQTGTTFNNSGNTVPWVAVTSNTTAITVVKGATTGASVDINAASRNGWPSFSTDSIGYAATLTPGFAAPTFNATSCSPGTPGPSCDVIMTVNAATPGSYTISVTGTYVAFDTTGLTVTLVAPLAIRVNVQDIAWSINGVSASSAQTEYIPAATSVPVSFTAQSLGGYTGSVTYSTNSLSDGGTGITFSYPAAFTLSAGATVNMPVTFVASTEGVAFYQATVTATGLTPKNSGGITIKVSGFSLATNTTSLSITTGKTAGISTTVQSLGNPSSPNGFAGQVTISKTVMGPGALTIKCTSPLTLVAGGTASGTCTFSSTTAGTFNITMKGTGGTSNSISNSTNVTVTITSAPGFTISASPTSVTILTSDTATSMIKISSQGTFSQPVSFSTSTIYPSGLACSVSPASTTPTAGGSATAVLSCNGQAGIYTVILTASATGFNGQFVQLKVTVQDFTISATTPGSIDVGQSGTSTVNIAPLTGFAGTIGLTAIPSIGLTATLSSTTITGGSGTATLSFTAATAGTYTVTITATSGTLVHSATISIQVVDFQIFASPTMLNTTPSVSSNSTITVTPLNGFTGTVNLSSSISPGTGLTCTLSTNTVTGGSGTSLLNCAGTGGTYMVTVVGTDGTILRTATVAVNVADFTLTAVPNSITSTSGIPGTSAVSVSAVGGFSGTVTFTASAPPGLTATLNPTLVSISGTVTLTVSVTTSTPLGVYLVNITGNNGVLTHTVTVTVTVVVPGVPPPFFTQMTWNHRFSLAKYGNIQTWRFGVQSNITTTIYFSVTINGIDTSGSSSFSQTTQVFSLIAGHNMNQITLSQSFSPSQIGDTFVFSAVIHWDTSVTSNPAQLRFTSTLTNGVPVSGSFTELP